MNRAVVAALTAIAVSAVASASRGVDGQPPAQPAGGDWRSYAGDLRNQHYSPLAQITGANFNALEVAWRFKTDSLGPRPEFKLEGTPLMVNGVLYTTAGTRRAVVALDAATGELRWVHAEYEGARAAASPRQLSGRGVAYWTDGRDERILYITTGYRLVALDARTGSRIASFGKDGIVDLKEGVVFGKGQQIDLVTGEIGVHSTPADHEGRRRDDRVVVPRRRHAEDPQQHQGAGPRLRRAHRQSGCGPSTRFRVPANSATTRG